MTDQLNLPCVLFVRDDPNSVIPTKGTPLSIGYDLTAISIAKRISSRTVLYDTGIKVQPPEGYYTEILPRSSLSKTGYMLSNSVGTIDPDYTGRLLIALTKVDDTLPDLELPFTRCQLVLRKAEFYNVRETDKLTETVRGDGGFGSTDAKASPDVPHVIAPALPHDQPRRVREAGVAVQPTTHSLEDIVRTAWREQHFGKLRSEWEAPVRKAAADLALDVETLERVLVANGIRKSWSMTAVDAALEENVRNTMAILENIMNNLSWLPTSVHVLPSWNGWHSDSNRQTLRQIVENITGVTCSVVKYGYPHARAEHPCFYIQFDPQKSE